MKNKLIIATSLLLVVAGSAAAQTSENFFNDDFFTDSDSDSDSFFEDDVFDDSESDEEETSSFFGDDPFFNNDDEEDDSSESEQNESEEADAGICVIGVDSPCNSDEYDGDNGTNNQSEDEETVVEERSVTEAPEPSYVGEDYLSYPNPRNHFLHDQDIHREGSMKVCKILLNQNGEVIEGDTVDATFSVETSNIPYEDADTITFDTPVNQVADLVGTSEELREGDGYLDAECAEYHDLRLNETYTYGQEEITGEDADKVEAVGYIEKWENRNTPISNVESYESSEDSDGIVRLEPGYNGRHAEVIIVNQIKNN